MMYINTKSALFLQGNTMAYFNCQNSLKIMFILQLKFSWKLHNYITIFSLEIVPLKSETKFYLFKIFKKSNLFLFMYKDIWMKSIWTKHFEFRIKYCFAADTNKCEVWNILLDKIFGEMCILNIRKLAKTIKECLPIWK